MTARSVGALALTQGGDEVLLDALDDNDDVQSVSANYEIADDVMERLTAA